jgi:putative DNA primase/helicase
MRSYFRREAWRAGQELFGTGLTLTKAMLAERIEALKAQALYDGPEHQVFLRVGQDADGTLYIDLCDRQWRAIRVGRFGWELINTPPIFFRRSKGMLPLPIPEPGGKIDELKSFLNINPADFPLVIAWLLAALWPRGPYPILVLTGGAGVAKTTFARLLVKLVDPDSAEVRVPPRTLDDLDVAALHNHCLAFDNVSYLSQRLSDAFCRLATEREM